MDMSGDRYLNKIPFFYQQTNEGHILLKTSTKIDIHMHVEIFV